MTTETKRDLNVTERRDLAADLQICDAATAGPWLRIEFDYTIIASDTESVINVGGSDRAYCDISAEDITFIAEARTGWPHAIKRAIIAESELAVWKRSLAVASGIQRLDAEAERWRRRALSAESHTQSILRALDWDETQWETFKRYQVEVSLSDGESTEAIADATQENGTQTEA
ncbi:hypothetical protein [Paenibacillus agricola]|uniref:Tail assembly chaperone n=1 Tax=Paenibacillus agricola TaxID=2716264 RepID=A0ABX0J4D8_9BACL|nr:hypothetical protein [Paenibacillus agricola]NHN31190.1 hypothetical protein [Paenibacillus agricola]